MWLKRFWIWLKDGRLLWITFAVLAVMFFWGFYPPITESRLRIAGLILQICGLMTVAKGILDTRKLFGHPSAWKATWKFLSRFPMFRPRTIAITASTLESVSILGRATGWITATASASIEHRISVLEKNLESIRHITNDLQTQIDKEVNLHKEAISTERSSREKVVLEIQQKLEKTETGGLNISLMGLLWLCFGIVLSTIPNEIISFFLR